MPNPGEVVIYDFAGARSFKRRPGVVVSTAAYHAQRPDVVLCLLTTNIRRATTSTDYVLKDWAAAGLNVPSAFRAYFTMALASNVRVIGKLSDADWQQVKLRVKRAVG